MAAGTAFLCAFEDAALVTTFALNPCMTTGQGEAGHKVIKAFIDLRGCLYAAGEKQRHDQGDEYIPEKSFLAGG